MVSPDRQTLPDLIPATLAGCPGYRIRSCDSTMDLAWDLAGRELLPEYGWILAETQERGRGQLGRNWISEPGTFLPRYGCPILQVLWEASYPLQRP